jgi:AcrR family transcriptional regulator
MPNKSSSTSPPVKASPRERLLAAADELFYEEGVNTVGIDRIIERAGVAKASLYDSFGSKEELVRSYLARRHEARRERLTLKLARYKTAKEKLLGIFDIMSESVAEANYRGCAFVRASAEARAGSSAKQVSDESRAWFRLLLADLAREAKARNPDRLADQFMMLYDGATVAAHMDGNTDAPVAARKVAQMLLAAACSK